MEKLSHQESSNVASQHSVPDEPAESKPAAQSQVAESVQPDLVLAEKHKELGNNHFRNNDFHEATESYFQALRHCPTEEKKMLSILYSNLSICSLKLKDYPLVVKYTTKSLEHDPTHRKAWLNQGQAQEADDKPDEAMESYKKAQQLKYEPELAVKLVVLQKKVDELNEKRKDEVLSGLKNIGNSILGYFGMSLDNFQLTQNEGGTYNVQFKQ